MTSQIFSKIPIYVRNDIPIFSKPDEYTKNYEKIANDHLDSLRHNGTNPFIPEELWVKSEDSTAELIQKYSKSNDKILDVGVGLGRLLEHFPKLMRYGMDISLGYLQIAQKKGINVCYAKIEDMPYQKELFDVILCTDVLEHVLDLNLCCTKILSVLKPEGILIVRVPYKEDLSKYLSSSYPYKYTHLRNFDENSLCLLFNRIFGCEFLDLKKAVYKPDGKRCKYFLPFPKQDRFLYHSLTMIKKIHNPSYESLLHKIYYPIEMNLVFRKK